MSERAIETVMAVVISALAAAALWGLFALTGCRKPPAPTDPIPADAAPIQLDAGPQDAGPAQDGSVSDCVSLPDLTCGLLAAEAEQGTWDPGKDTAIDSVRDELRDALLGSGGALCGQASGVVHYIGDDAAVHPIFMGMMDGWVSAPIVFDPDGRECSTVQDFEREGIVVRLRTRRAQRSFSVEVRVAP